MIIGSLVEITIISILYLVRINIGSLADHYLLYNYTLVGHYDSGKICQRLYVGNYCLLFTIYVYNLYEYCESIIEGTINQELYISHANGWQISWPATANSI